MMKKKTHKIISIFLIISLLFAEMYIAALPAEDSFARDLSGQMAAFITFMILSTILAMFIDSITVILFFGRCND